MIIFSESKIYLGRPVYYGGQHTTNGNRFETPKMPVSRSFALQRNAFRDAPCPATQIVFRMKNPICFPK